jgi:hypothetical protein
VLQGRAGWWGDNVPMTIQSFLEFRREAERGTLERYYDSLSVYDKVEAIKTFRKIQEAGFDDAENSIYSNYNVITNIEYMVLGQFIMIEQIMNTQTDTKELQVLNLIVRPKDDQEFNYVNSEVEQQHSKTIAQLDAIEGIQIFNKFVAQREETLFKKFKGVIYQEPDESIEEEEKEPDSSPEAQFGRMWYWYSIIRELAGEDILRQDQVNMLKMSKVLVELAYKIQKGRIEYSRQRREEMMRKR